MRSDICAGETFLDYGNRSTYIPGKGPAVNP
jgi:hypothetical protein